MTTLFIILGVICILAGIFFSIVPIIPGPVLAYGSLLLLQATGKHPFTTEMLIILALVIGFILVMDYIVPIWGTKKFGGSKYGAWGSFFGIFVGFFLGPFGFILGPFLGALIGELVGGKELKIAVKAAFGSFVGFMVTVVMKLGIVGYVIYLFVKACFSF